MLELITRTTGRVEHAVQSPALTNTSPKWSEDADQRIRALMSLEAGWDGHGAEPVRGHVGHYAIGLLNSISDANTAAPTIVPTTSGGLQLEWHANNIDIEIEIEVPYSETLFIEYLDDGEMIERPFEWKDPDFSKALKLVSA
ncbi:hypothetical protein [Thioclava sp. IC9]|uniref:hypothetical protein n=1 Tax=Thioclava sp. IC9 TaxID=1973007 RepID=UPI000B54477B|nr:hypothetical protein [Thioclava sp. IC9]OWY02317.1 hypothetical protein B6V76_12910 [Thioclava sp. IC9]